MILKCIWKTKEPNSQITSKEIKVVVKTLKTSFETYVKAAVLNP